MFRKVKDDIYMLICTLGSSVIGVVVKLPEAAVAFSTCK